MKYHDAQVTFFTERNEPGTDAALERCRSLIGGKTWSQVTEKEGTITNVRVNGFNVFLTVRTME